MTINKCPLCGGTAREDATGAAEINGMAWQTAFIECSKDGEDPHCLHQVSIESDFMCLSESVWPALRALWNALEPAKRMDAP